jgi:hypothetical protein
MYIIKRRLFFVYFDPQKICPPQKTIDHSFGLEKNMSGEQFFGGQRSKKDYQYKCCVASAFV